MPVTPQITLNGKLVDLFGNAIAGSLVFTLCGYRNSIPRINGTGFIAQIQPLKVQAANDGTWNTLLWGNDVITPANTYYTVQVYDDKGALVECNAYQFAGIVNADLSTLAPFVIVVPLPAAPNPVLLNPAGIQIIAGGIVIQGSLTVTGALIVNSILVVAWANNAVFNAAAGNGGTDFEMTLTGDVNLPTTANLQPGQLYTFTLIQDGVGGHAFVWPASVINGGVIEPDANSISTQTFIARANGKLYAVGPMMYS